MTEAVEAIAGTLVEAAYELFGRPPDPGGLYVKDVAREKDVPGYFRELVRLAGEPRSRALWKQHEAFFDGDAAMVTEAGLKQLAKDQCLPGEQRRIIEEVRAFEAWERETRTQLDQEANEQAAREAGPE